MIVEHGRLSNGPGVLQLEHALLLDTQHDNVLAAHADGARSLAHRLGCVVYLEQMACKEERGLVGRKRGRRWEGRGEEKERTYHLARIR